MGEGGRKPETPEPSDITRTWKHLFFRWKADGNQCASLLYLYRLSCRRIFCRYVPEFEGERGGFAGRLSVT